jgi:Flp pilus assembly protein TadD
MPPRSAGGRSPLAQAFAEAVGHHNAGRLDDADAVCQRILGQQPRNGDVLNLLGATAGRRGRPDVATKWFRKAVQSNKRSPIYHCNLAMSLHALGEMRDAEKHYRDAIALDRDYAEPLNGLGGVLAATGRHGEAEACCRRVVKLQPNNPRAHANLAGVLIGAKKATEAETSARRALELKPDYVEAVNTLCSAMITNERYEEAIELLRDVIAKAPDYVDAQNNLGLALIATYKHADAIACFETAIERRPDHADAHNNLGNCYWFVGRDKEAVVEFEETLRCRPGMVNATTKLGEVALFNDDVEGALRRFDEVLERVPDWQDALNGKARVFEQSGDLDACRDFIAPLLAVESPAPSVVASFARVSRRTEARDEAIALLERTLGRDNLDESQEKLLRFTLGSLYDQANEFDLAFENFDKGNAQHPKIFEADEFEEQIGQIIEAYQPARASALPRAGNESRLPVFIVGMPRSGTSLTEQILASHHAVHGAGELRELGDAIRTMSGTSSVLDAYPGFPANLAQDTLDDAAEQHLAFLAGRGGEAECVTDKMPYNYLHLGFIARMFPGARIVHCMRDPIDTCLSCYFQNFRRGNAQTFDQRSLGAYYRQYQRLMAFWRETLEIPMFEISYERLVADLEGESRRLVDFLGLEWDPACLEFHRSKRMVHTASYDQVRQPIYTRSVERWRHYERHIGPLREALEGAT